jgi:hypothetical protein
MDSKLNVTFYFENGASQHTNMSLDAFNHFTNEEEVPRKYTRSQWKKLPPVKRIEHYLSEIMDDLGAVDCSYKIMKT